METSRACLTISLTLDVLTVASYSIYATAIFSRQGLATIPFSTYWRVNSQQNIGCSGERYRSTTFGEKFKDEHYSIDVLNAILSIFQMDPCSSSLSRSEWAFRGFEGLECLEQALTASLLHPHLLGQTRLRMRACTDDVLAWMDSSIQTCYQDLLLDPSAFQRHLASNASAVVACLALKGAFLDKFVQHPVLITTLLTLWPSILVKNAAEAIFKVEEAGTSAILSAFKTAVGHESGFHAIAALLVYNPIKLELFCRPAVARTLHVPHFTNKTEAITDLDEQKTS
ncbi:hypothetical protein BKA70DRAFT_1242301 [Coprinopsis sp. MPI-PUGE-AT-0042]|nr:hypothetical protein BKA70DRAFT_1242301 [Coprinopsis sp. MPI-PUGE-AT-0042]